jgi:tRNA dimethylallyltransferase
MDIGTAKPSKEILNKHPHFLIDICNPEDTYSVGDFLFDASHQIKKSLNKNRIPLLVGGTMLYFHALINGIADLPKSDKKIRTDIEKEAEEIGWKKMHLKLKNIDPTAAEKINYNDKQRIQRALEVYELTGKKISELQTKKKNKREFEFQVFVKNHITREDLYKKINQRFIKMINNGFVDEVSELMKRKKLTARHPSMRSVGYRQIWQYLDNEISLEKATDLAQIATRQLAKRQYTWLNNMENITKIDSQNNNILSQIKLMI